MPDRLLLANAGDGMWVCVKGNKKARMRQQTGVKEGERERGEEKPVQKGEHLEALFFLPFFPLSFKREMTDGGWRQKGSDRMRRGEVAGEKTVRKDDGCGGRSTAETPINLQPGVNNTGWCQRGGRGINGKDPRLLPDLQISSHSSAHRLVSLPLHTNTHIRDGPALAKVSILCPEVKACGTVEAPIAVPASHLAAWPRRLLSAFGRLVQRMTVAWESRVRSLPWSSALCHMEVSM